MTERLTIAAESWDLMVAAKRAADATATRLEYMQKIAVETIADQRRTIESQHAEILRLRTELARAIEMRGAA